MKFIILIFGFIFIFKIPVLAWGPQTHTFIGYGVLSILKDYSIPEVLLILNNSIDFYYGLIAPDFFVGKGSKTKINHCHNWEQGFKLMDNAQTDKQKSFSFGYLCHLAADIIAHNYFIPKQLTNTRVVYNLMHSYWETRFETHLPQELARVTDIILKTHNKQNDMFLKQNVIRNKVFKIRKNLFKHSVKVSNIKSIRNLHIKYARKKISEEYISVLLRVCIGVCKETLLNYKKSFIFNIDPIGADTIHILKKTKVKTRKLNKNYIDNKLFDLAISEKFLECIYKNFQNDYNKNINLILNFQNESD
jgi:hypothetical protein